LSLIRAYQSGLSEVSSTAVSLCPPSSLLSTLHLPDSFAFCHSRSSFSLFSSSSPSVVAAALARRYRMEAKHIIFSCVHASFYPLPSPLSLSLSLCLLPPSFSILSLVPSLPLQSSVQLEKERE